MRDTSPVPQTRPELERETKIEEIVGTAARRVAEGGYGALSVAAIGRELGLSPNSVYWYFPSKDELFVASVRRILAGILAAKPPRRMALESRVLWFAEQLDDVDHVRRSLYERARSSAVVAAFVRELESGLREMLTNALAGSVAESDVGIAADALLATAEGASARNLTKADRRRVVSYALRRFTSPEAPRRPHP
jgi:AcrR family transcriptional regulator